MSIFFTSDTHFGHEGIIRHISRPFPDSFTMDGELVRRWNSVVRPGDTVYHLGDLSFKGVGYTAHILEQLNGDIHWVLGNHDKALKNIYLIGQDYSFGQAVLREARRQIEDLRPDMKIVGEELHPVGRVKDFLPYATKIKASGAQAVITGNWGNDLTLLVKAAREAGFEGKFYTFYGNALGAPAAIGEAGVGRVVAVADWLPNVPGKESAAFYKAFRERFAKPQEDYVHLRMQLMLEALAQAAALLAFDTLGVTPDDKTVYYFAGIDGARFKRPVEPGDQLVLDVTLDRAKASIFKYTGKVYVGDDIACEAELMCTMRAIACIAVLA